MRTIRITLLIIVLLMVSAISFAQTDYAHLEAVLGAQPESLPKNLNKKDLNGDPASVLLVSSPLTGLLFDGNVLDVTETQDIAEDSNIYLYYVYITKGTKRLTIKHRSYVQTQIEFPKTVDSKQLWNMTVTGIEAPETSIVERLDIEYKHDVNIMVEDWADLYIDDELYSEYNSSLEEGIHYISTRYKGQEYAQKVYVKERGQLIDARIGGEVVIKNANVVTLIPFSGYEPKPNFLRNSEKSCEYDEMLGNYYLTGIPNVLRLSKNIIKIITVDPHKQYTYRLDEMIPYIFVMYHGSYQQFIGINMGWCSKFGFFISFCGNLVDSVNTQYGNITLKPSNKTSENNTFNNSASKNDEIELRNTIMTLSIGPMSRIYRMIYMQAGAGWVRYLNTSEPGILTADYEYKNGFAINADLLFRIKSFVIGAGYKRLFTSDAYNIGIKNQLSFSIGISLTYN